METQTLPKADKAVLTYEQTEKCIQHIRKRIKEEHVYGRCENTRTIAASNRLWNYYLNKFKQEAFKLIEGSLVKPHVIYRVNRYYQI